MVISGTILALISLLVTSQSGFDVADILYGTTKSPISDTERHILRLLLLLNQVGLFLFPAILFVLFLKPRETFSTYYSLKKFPDFSTISRNMLWFLIAMPAISFAYVVNKSIPLPSWMTRLEDQSATALKLLLGGNNIVEFILNFLLIAVLAPLAEELIFRGILQKELSILIKKSHLSIWLAAMIFSAIHFQFEGFIPRMMLGVMLGYVYFWSGSLWTSIICHSFVNGSQLIVQYFIDPTMVDSSIDTKFDFHWSVGIIFVVITFGMGYLFNQKYNTAEVAPNQSTLE
ncbi:MAG: CPBP family intramembrane metalloprotease [Saprospiraceae bacterium]|nr:CPBP family intramembrane metalloprotease [Saprospiraceae bacterium]